MSGLNQLTSLVPESQGCGSTSDSTIWSSKEHQRSIKLQAGPGAKMRKYVQLERTKEMIKKNRFTTPMESLSRRSMDRVETGPSASVFKCSF